MSGLHWHGWNGIKNEAVGHTSLELSKDLITKFGSDINAENIYNHLRESTYSTEGSENLRTNAKLIADKGSFRIERVSNGLGGDTGNDGRGTRKRVPKSREGVTFSVRSAEERQRFHDELDRRIHSDPEVYTPIWESMRRKVLRCFSECLRSVCPRRS